MTGSPVLQNTKNLEAIDRSRKKKNIKFNKKAPCQQQVFLQRLQYTIRSDTFLSQNVEY